MAAEDFRLLLAGFELLGDPRNALAGQPLEMLVDLKAAILFQDIGGNRGQGQTDQQHQQKHDARAAYPPRGGRGGGIVLLYCVHTNFLSAHT